ncbi:DUF3599 family protein [Listeria booriae]|uniref:DUF3599 family protein n=1 Tax=Listeria booriae TaxID=1552123 RepID=UPI00162ABE04|nr:DUF3599 family protein [Listeria booriae]MBC2369953.1 DUF3599 family protein [Listeria booriae]
MSYEKLLTDRCEIFHLSQKANDDSKSFGISIENLPDVIEYGEGADIKDVKCYITKRSESVSQGEPQNVMIQSYLVHFRKNTDVRNQDKLISGDIVLILQEPKTIKNHHIEVEAFRKVVL